MKRVYVHLYSQSEPVIISDVLNTYTKDGLFCVLLDDDKDQKVYKFPIMHIFRITEFYV
jgi:hypothetical protein